MSEDDLEWMSSKLGGMKEIAYNNRKQGHVITRSFCDRGWQLQIIILGVKRRGARAKTHSWF